MAGRETNLTKNMSIDRTLVLKPMEGKDVKDAKGMVDNRLFSGENNIHACMDPEYGHWYVKYDAGIAPPPLQQRWTSFTKLYEFVSNYYKTRNVEIKEIVDN